MHTPSFLQPYFDKENNGVQEYFIPNRHLTTEELTTLSKTLGKNNIKYHIIPNTGIFGEYMGTTIKVGTDGESYPWHLTTKIRGNLNS